MLGVFHGVADSGLRAQELVPQTPTVQTPFRVTPSVASSQEYDSNLFATFVAAQADFMTRVSPGIEAIAVTLDPANKELVLRLLASNLRLTNTADAEESYHAVINSYERAPHTSLEGMKRLHKLMTQINPNIADVRVENVIDNSFMNKLETSGYIQSVYKKN